LTEPAGPNSRAEDNVQIENGVLEKSETMYLPDATSRVSTLAIDLRRVRQFTAWTTKRPDCSPLYVIVVDGGGTEELTYALYRSETDTKPIATKRSGGLAQFASFTSDERALRDTVFVKLCETANASIQAAAANSPVTKCS